MHVGLHQSFPFFNNIPLYFLGIEVRSNDFEECLTGHTFFQKLFLRSGLGGVCGGRHVAFVMEAQQAMLPDYSVTDLGEGRATEMRHVGTDHPSV